MMLSNYFTTITSGEIALQLQRFLKHYITIKLYTMAITNNVSICKPSGEATFMQYIPPALYKNGRRLGTQTYVHPA